MNLRRFAPAAFVLFPFVVVGALALWHGQGRLALGVSAGAAAGMVIRHWLVRRRPSR